MRYVQALGTLGFLVLLVRGVFWDRPIPAGWAAFFGTLGLVAEDSFGWRIFYAVQIWAWLFFWDANRQEARRKDL